jgi:hypothetical protein
MKHVGKMKNNSARVVVVYRTIPGDHLSALVVGTQGLTDSYHDSLMSLIQDDSAQSANELADVLAVRRFPDGSNMLEYLHTRGHLKKVPTNLVLMTPNTQATVQLDELNKIIAEQRGVTVEDLAITENGKPATKASIAKKANSEVIITEPIAEDQPTTAVDMRSKADRLFKEAQELRKQADELDPPKAKVKTKKSTVEA